MVQAIDRRVGKTCDSRVDWLAWVVEESVVVTVVGETEASHSLHRTVHDQERSIR